MYYSHITVIYNAVSSNATLIVFSADKWLFCLLLLHGDGKLVNIVFTTGDPTNEPETLSPMEKNNQHFGCLLSCISTLAFKVWSRRSESSEWTIYHTDQILDTGSFMVPH